MSEDSHDVLARKIQPEAGRDRYGNEYEDGVILIEGTEIQGRCSIGRGTSINNAVVYPQVRIGRYCSIARGAAVGAPNHPMSGVSTSLAFPAISGMLSFKTTSIGHDVWIGANATVLGGVRIGHGAIVGAGALVTHDVGPYEIVTGAPATVRRRRFSDEICTALLATEWWTLPPEVLSGLPMSDVEAFVQAVRNVL